MQPLLDGPARASCERAIQQHDVDMEAARLVDEAAGHLDLANEPSPFDINLETEIAASFSEVA